MINVQVEYRTKTRLPTKDGWYFGKWKSSECTIVPQYVTDKLVYFSGMDVFFPVADFDWFGPVPEIKEG